MPTQTFYVPVADTDVTQEFVEICKRQQLNYSNVLMEFVKDYNDENRCETCDNKGTIEVPENCGKTASNCCGGCFVTKPCPDC